MAIEITVPSLGESVTEATVAKWCKKKGDYVQADEMVAELETDKVTLEVNAPVSGVISEQAVAEGATVKVGALLGKINEKATAPSPGKAKEAVAEKAKVAVYSAATMEKQNDRTPVLSPAAHKIAQEKQVSLTSGSGKDGRVTKGDVLQALTSGKTGDVSVPGGGRQRREERVKMSKLRQAIARRLKESQNTAAMLTTFNEVDMSRVIALRNQYKDAFEKKHGVKLGFMSFFVKAAIIALQEIPSVNAQIEGEDIVYKHYYDIGVAVGGAQGLVVPVVRNAEMLSFAGIEETIADFGKRARDGKLSVAEMSGGTFTISNGGVFGSLLSTPIINPPQTAILGMHKTQDRPVAIDGKVEIRPMMYLALSYDHRLIDGKEAVTFLVRIKECIEDPQRLLLDM